MTTVLTLPFPVSVNAMFSDGKTRRHKSQRYCDWIMEAGYALNAQRPPKITGQVMLGYLLQEGIDNRRRDLGNYEKCVTDLLVSHGVIEADDGRIVREITLRWSREVKGIQITITPIAAGEEGLVLRTSTALQGASHARPQLKRTAQGNR